MPNLCVPMPLSLRWCEGCALYTLLRGCPHRGLANHQKVLMELHQRSHGRIALEGRHKGTTSISIQVLLISHTTASASPESISTSPSASSLPHSMGYVYTCVIAVTAYPVPTRQPLWPSALAIYVPIYVPTIGTYWSDSNFLQGLTRCLQ